MFRPKSPRISNGTLALALGAAVGTAAAMYLGWRQLRTRGSRPREILAAPEELATIEDATVGALRQDTVAGNRAIEVAALGNGIIELTGVVRDLGEAHHAVDIAQRVDGVHTVINRMTLGDVEKHLADTRERKRAGDPQLEETQWYGMNVGTGRRRQSSDTDPSLRDDRNEAVTRALEPDAIAEFPDDVERMSASEATKSGERNDRPMQ
ncbi:MAG: BON domain-containing protein [Longimicrobiales bacterium]